MWPSPAECKVYAGCTLEALLTVPPGRESGFSHHQTVKEVLALAGVWARTPSAVGSSVEDHRLLRRTVVHKMSA